MKQRQIYKPMCGCVQSCFSCVQLLATLWTVASQPPLSMGFPRQGYWSGLPRSPSGDLSNQGIRLISPESPALQVDSLLLSHQGSTYLYIYVYIYIYIHRKHTIYIT